MSRTDSFYKDTCHYSFPSPIHKMVLDLPVSSRETGSFPGSLLS